MTIGGGLLHKIRKGLAVEATGLRSGAPSQETII